MLPTPNLMQVSEQLDYDIILPLEVANATVAHLGHTMTIQNQEVTNTKVVQREMI